MTIHLIYMIADYLLGGFIIRKIYLDTQYWYRTAGFSFFFLQQAGLRFLFWFFRMGVASLIIKAAIKSFL